jgi:hypothetical protein
LRPELKSQYCKKKNIYIYIYIYMYFIFIYLFKVFSKWVAYVKLLSLLAKKLKT